MAELGGLICRLFLPGDLTKAIDWEVLIASLTPYVDAFLIDPCYWASAASTPDPDFFPNPQLIHDLLEYLPADRPLLIHITSASRDLTIANLRRWNEILNDKPHFDQVIWVDAPLQYHSNRGLPDAYRWLARTSEKPFVLENDPQRVRPAKSVGRRANIRTHVLKSLAENRSVIGLIHHGDLRRALNYSRATAARRNFKLLDGDEHHFLEYPSTTGLVSLTANVCPKDWSILVGRSRPGKVNRDPQTLYTVFRRLQYLSQTVHQWQAAESIAYLLYRKGLLKSPPPLPRATVGDLEKLWDILSESAEPCTAS